MNPYVMIYSIVLTFIWLNHYMMANCIWIGLSNLELNLTGGRCIWQSWLIRITSFLAEGDASSTNENWPQQNNKLWWKNGINHQIINQFYQCKAQQCIHPCYIYFAYRYFTEQLIFQTRKPWINRVLDTWELTQNIREAWEIEIPKCVARHIKSG